jgi:hypothetical protein
VICLLRKRVMGSADTWFKDCDNLRRPVPLPTVSVERVSLRFVAAYFLPLARTDKESQSMT